MPASSTMGIRIVVVDDEPEIGDLIAATAGAIGMNCSAISAPAKLRESLGPDVGAVMIDLMMPGTDGIELLRILSEKGFNAGVILMSGQDRAVLRAAEELALVLGLDLVGALQKPFRISELEALLRTVPSRPRRDSTTKQCPSTELTEPELRSAIEQEKVVVHFQPQIALSSGRVVGLEALARIQSSGGDLIYPETFVGVSERIGLIDALTSCVMKRALHDFRYFSALSSATLSINVSAYSLVDLRFPDRLEELARESGVAMARLVLEITETGLIKELGSALEILARLRLRGVGLSIDDFGTGYSSMAQLCRIPATELKIDRQFVGDMLRDARSRMLVEETVDLGHRLGLSTVAEGVETYEHALALNAAKCDIGQGYFFSRPVSTTDLCGWLASGSGGVESPGAWDKTSFGS